MNSEENEFKDYFIEAIAKNADRNELSKDFENNLMAEIRLRNEFKNDIKSKLRTSLYYFIIAALLILVSAIVTVVSKSSGDSSFGLLSVITLFTAITILILITSNYSRFLQNPMVYKKKILTEDQYY